MGIPEGTKQRFQQRLSARERAKDRLPKVLQRRNLTRAFRADGSEDFDILRVIPKVYESLVEGTALTAPERKLYLRTQAQREAKELTAHHGFLCFEEPFARSGFAAADGKYIFVLAPDDRLYVQQEPTGLVVRKDDFTHACFLAGSPCKVAGEIFIRRGRVKYLNNASGHYLPPPSKLEHIVSWLRKNKAEGDAQVVCLFKDKPNTKCPIAHFHPNRLPDQFDDGSMEVRFHDEQVWMNNYKTKIKDLGDRIEAALWDGADPSQSCNQLYGLIASDIKALHPMVCIVLGVMCLDLGGVISFSDWQRS